MASKPRFEKGDILFLDDLEECIVIDTELFGSDKFVELLVTKGGSTKIRPVSTLFKEITKKEEFHYPIIWNAPRESYWWTVGFLAKHGTVEIRTIPRTEEITLGKYIEISGCDFKDLDRLVADRHIVYNPNELTRADNASICFREPPYEIKKNLYLPENTKGKQDGVRKGKDHIIFYNRRYVWTLFKYGFRAGNEHNIDSIRKYLQYQKENYRFAFKEGFACDYL